MISEDQLSTPFQNTLEPASENGTQDSDFADLLDEYMPQPLKQGQFIAGEILKIDHNVILANVAAKRTAIIPSEDIARLTDAELAQLNVGDEVTLFVLRTPVGDDDLIVSINKGLEYQDWANAKDYLADEEMLELEVIGHNKGGLVVAFGHLRGFVPLSHVPQLQNLYNEQHLAEQKARLVGKELPLKVIEVDRDRRRLVLSGKKAQKERRRQRLQELNGMIGETISGRITNIVHFGAFIELDGVEGLIHKSELAWEKVHNPAEYVSPGEKVAVLLQSVDLEQERVSLSRKALLPSPWTLFAQTKNSGDLVEGVVTNVTDFGAFVEVSEGIEGLIHVSEMYKTETAAPQDVLFNGETIMARIIDIQPERQRLGLSQRRVSEAEEMEWIFNREQAANLAAFDEEE